MLRVTVELVPHGNEDAAVRIGEMIIANDGMGTSQAGNYQAVINSDKWSGDPIRHSNIGNWSRDSSVWDLIETLLSVAQDSMLPEEGLYRRMVRRFKGNKK